MFRAQGEIVTRQRQRKHVVFGPTEDSCDVCGPNYSIRAGDIIYSFHAAGIVTIDEMLDVCALIYSRNGIITKGVCPYFYMSLCDCGEFICYGLRVRV